MRSPRRGTYGAGVPAALRWRSRLSGHPAPCRVVRLLFDGGATRERDQANAIRRCQQTESEQRPTETAEERSLPIIEDRIARWPDQQPKERAGRETAGA